MNRDQIEACLSQLEEFFEELARRLSTELAAQMMSITPHQFFMLKKIKKKKRATISETAKSLGVSLSSITNMAERLHRAGLVKRYYDTENRRFVWLELTDKGERVVEDGEANQRMVATRYFGQLSGEDLEKLVEICGKLAEIMNRERKK